MIDILSVTFSPKILSSSTWDRSYIPIPRRFHRQTAWWIMICLNVDQGNPDRHSPVPSSVILGHLVNVLVYILYIENKSQVETKIEKWILATSTFLTDSWKVKIIIWVNIDCSHLPSSGGSVCRTLPLLSLVVEILGILLAQTEKNSYWLMKIYIYTKQNWIWAETTCIGGSHLTLRTCTIRKSACDVT